jgi:hypothetical protein
MDNQNVQRMHAGPDSAEDVIAAAREAEPFAVPPSEHTADPDQDAWLEAAFTALPASVFNPVVLAAVDRLMLDSESVSVTARQRLVGGADRGVRWRQRLSDELNHLLRDRRAALGLPPSTIASRIGIGAALIAKIETGAEPIEALPADRVGAWIRVVGMDPATALTALHRSQCRQESPGGPMTGFACDVADALGDSPRSGGPHRTDN